jgi:hypothetical protein
MARDNESQSLREYGNRRKRYKRIRNFIILVLIIAAAAAGISYFIYINNKSYHEFKVIKTTEISGDTAVGYLSYGSAVIKYGHDGALAYDKTGKVLWNESYEMSDPITDICEEYVVIADRGGTAIHIFNNKGEVGSITTLYSITDVEVAHQGVVAVMSEDGEKNHYYLYDQDGTNLVDKANTVNNAGYPLDITLSNDGTKLVIVYMSVTTGELISNVTCWNFSEVGENYTDNFAGNFTSPKGVLVPKVVFLNNNTFCSYKDNGFLLFSMRELPKVIKEITLDGAIKSVLYNKDYAGFVLESKDGSSKHLMLYDLKGDLALDKPIDFDYSKIYLTDSEIIIYNNTGCSIMKMNGKVKFKYTFDSNITGLYPINNLDRYYLVNETGLSDIQLGD